MRLYTFIAVAVMAGFILTTTQVHARGDTRTANRSVKSVFVQLFKRSSPKHLGSNYRSWSPVHRHDAQWADTHWNPEHWNKAYWNADTVLGGFYANGILHNQYLTKAGHPVIAVGPQFYELAYVDQLRVIRLVADSHAFFESGHSGIQLRDWHNRELIGHYDANGLAFSSRGPILK